MSSSIDPRLQRLLGGDRYAPLRKRLRQRFERAPFDAEVESFRIGKLTTDEHAVLASLLGRPIRYSSSLQVDVRLIDIAFQNAGIAVSLRNALEQLDGPIANLATTRLALQTIWSDVLDGCTHRALIVHSSSCCRHRRAWGCLSALQARARRRRSNSAAGPKQHCSACPRAASHVHN